MEGLTSAQMYYEVQRLCTGHEEIVTRAYFSAGKYLDEYWRKQRFSPDVSYDDILQEAMIAVLLTIEATDKQKVENIGAYAYVAVRNAIKRITRFARNSTIEIPLEDVVNISLEETEVFEATRSALALSAFERTLEERERYVFAGIRDGVKKTHMAKALQVSNASITQITNRIRDRMKKYAILHDIREWLPEEVKAGEKGHGRDAGKADCR